MQSGEHIEEELSLCPKTWRRMMKGSGRCPQQTAPGIGPGSSQKRLGSKPAATFLAKVWRQELQKPSRARAARRRAPSPSQSYRRRRPFDEGRDPPCCVLLLFSGLRGPQGHAKLGPSWRGCDRTGAAGASPIGPGPTERDPGPGRDSTWDQLNALGPTEHTLTH